MTNNMIKWMKKKDNKQKIWIGLGLILAYFFLFADPSRAGFFGGSYIVGIILLAGGIGLAFVPGMQMVGIGMAAGGLMLTVGTAFLQKWVNEYGIWFWVVLGVVIILFLKMRGRRY